MPISQAQFLRSNLMLLVGGTLVLLAIVIASFWLTWLSERQFDEVVSVRATRSATADLLSIAQDAETGQRGYLLSRDVAYLAPYAAAVALFEPALQRLKISAGAAELAQAEVARLERALRDKLAELAQTIALAERGAWDEAVATVRQDSGRNLMDGIRAGLGKIIVQSEQRLQQAIAGQEAASAWLRWTIVLGALFIILLAAAAFWAIARYTREIIAARSEVTALNVGLEHRVRQRTEALTRANEEIQRFAYIVTHDLRAPLVNIMGFTSELEATAAPIKAYFAAGDAASPAALQEARTAVEVDLPEAIGFIRSSTRKMDGLINAILKISREGKRVLRAEAVDLPATLKAAAAAVHHQATENGDGIIVDCPPLKIRSDRLSMEQILGNLLDNAIKYKSPKRELKVVMRAKREKTGWVVIDVEDNGRGIAPADHERIFELFRRSGAQDRPGEGIGLAHVRTIVRNLGGDITVSSELDAGTTFSILLPPDLSAVQRSAVT
jgi:signal transduction histidine kinase